MARKQRVLPGVDGPNGKLIDTTSIVIMVPKVIEGVEVRKMDNGFYRAMKDDNVGDGETYAKATKALARLLK